MSAGGKTGLSIMRGRSLWVLRPLFLWVLRLSKGNCHVYLFARISITNGKFCRLRARRSSSFAAMLPKMGGFLPVGRPFHCPVHGPQRAYAQDSLIREKGQH